MISTRPISRPWFKVGLAVGVLLVGLAGCRTADSDAPSGDDVARMQMQHDEQLQMRTLIAEAMEARQRRDYAAAERAIEQALAIRPHDPTARAVRQGLDDTRLLLAARDARAQRDHQIARQRVKNIQASTPYSDLQTYPRDWPEMTQRRRTDERY